MYCIQHSVVFQSLDFLKTPCSRHKREKCWNYGMDREKGREQEERHGERGAEGEPADPSDQASAAGESAGAAGGEAGGADHGKGAVRAGGAQPLHLLRLLSGCGPAVL